MKSKSFLCLTLLMGVVSIHAQHVAQKKLTSVKGDAKAGIRKVKPKIASATSTFNNKNLSNFMVDSNLSTNIEIRFIDSFEVMGSCQEGIKARHDLEEKREVLGKEIQQEEQKITQIMSEYKGKSSMLSDSAREKEEKKLMKMDREYKNKIQESEEELKIDMQKKTENLARNVDKAVIKVAKEEKLDAVVDKVTGRVIYVDEKFDFTVQVKGEMNKQYEIKLAQNKRESSKLNMVTTAQANTVQTSTV